jgi:hypothetical protein
MQRFMNAILAFACLFIASAAGAANYSDLYIIPVAGHARGAFGTAWRSDVVVHNIQQVPITVELALVESGRSPSTEPIAIAVGAETSLQLAPGETRLLSDVLGAQGRDVTGALIVGAGLPFALTSRTWAELPAGRTLGQMVTPVAIAGTSNTAMEVSILTGLNASERQRSNVGVFIAASHAPLVAEIALRSSSGAMLGSTLVVVEEAGFSHRQFSLAPPAAGVTAVVRILEGGGIAVPYASMIDNLTTEAIFVSGEPIGARPAAARTMLGSPIAMSR